MPKIFKYVLAIFFLHIGCVSAYASDAPIDREDAFIYLASLYKSEVPESYQYIDLLYKDVQESSILGDALQILVYLDKISNSRSLVYPSKSIDTFSLDKLAEKVTGENWSINGVIWERATKNDLLNITKTSSSDTPTITIRSSFDGVSIDSQKEDLFNDVYETLSRSHYESDDFTEDQLIEWAIKWLAEGTGDTYTSYFPPVESDDFFQWLEWEYEGIGAYIDMTDPGVLLIVSPIVWSPAEKAWIKWWDRITHVDGKEITSENSQREVISWIKWPAGTSVDLTVERAWETESIIISVIRDRIVLKDVEHEKLESDTYYIQIKNFWDSVEKEFSEAITEITSDNSIKRIVIDLRNNPGGYLDAVSRLLGHIIPAGDATAIVSDRNDDIAYRSPGYGSIDLSNYKVIILQNWGTASASEIMIGTIKDYFPEVITLGEQSFWKWSVQSLKTYYDGSTLKYTTARWYTGKSRTAIDGIWITPDVFLEFDNEIYSEKEVDNQLDRALEY